MNKLNQILIILLITVGFVKTQPALSQTRYNATQETYGFKFTTWNSEWLSCTNNGPVNEDLQMNNIISVIKTMNSDIIALQEVGTSGIYATIDTLVRRLGNEWSGNIVTSTVDNCAQNQAIIYKKAKIQLVSSSLIGDGGSSYDWSSGRFPVLYNVNLLVGTTVVPVSFINIHAKAMGDETSYTRRKNASQGLKALLDGSSYNAKKIVLLGDFNDYLSGTQCGTCVPSESPYKNFMDDAVNYKCLTPGLYDPAYSSPVIDNIIISNELFDIYKQNSTFREESAAQSILNYTSTTSDHVPVSANFSITQGSTSCENITYSETFASSLGEFLPYSVEGSQIWYWRQTYGTCMSGYVSSLNYPNEDWLISPAFNFSGKSSATLAFNHALNFCASESDRINNQTLWVSNNYSNGAPANATWTQLTIPNMPLGNSWAFVNSGNIELPTQMMQNNVRFAFKYKSSSTVASSWEIRELTLNTNCTLTDVSTENAKPQSTVYVSDKQIKIRNHQLEPATVYDITGRILFSVPDAMNIEIPIYQSGVYIVRVGNEVHKIIVK